MFLYGEPRLLRKQGAARYGRYVGQMRNNKGESSRAGDPPTVSAGVRSLGAWEKTPLRQGFRQGLLNPTVD